MEPKRVSLLGKVWSSQNGYEIWAGIMDDKMDTLLLAEGAGTEKKAIDKLKKSVMDTLTEAHLNKENWQQTAIGCGDGTVLVVQFKHGHWGYSMSGPDRKHGSSMSMGPNDTHKSAMEAAKKHAEQCYGGVKWECSL